MPRFLLASTLLALVWHTLVGAAAPAATEKKLLVDDPQTITRFGTSVDVVKKLAVVGDPDGRTSADDGGLWSGAAFVFQKKGGKWSQAARLAYDGVQLFDDNDFGHSVATDGKKTIAVGAPGENGGKGAVFVFEKSGGSWAQTAKLEPSGGDTRFGVSVAMDSDTIVVGAPWSDSDGSGAVYVFTPGSTRRATWQEEARIELEGGDAGGGQGLDFGRSVDISGSTIVAGAPGHDDGEMLSDSGIAQVFVRDSSRRSWSHQATLKADDQTRFFYFGEAVAIHKKTIVAGSRGSDFSDSGAGYVFTRGGTRAATWTQSAKLTASDAEGGEWLGSDTVAVHKRTIVLGAPFDAESGALAGAAYKFTRKGAAWTEAEKILASDGAAAWQFGRAAAVFNKTILLGAALGAQGGESEAGAAYVYE